MIASTTFNYKEIMKKAKKVDSQISLSSENVKYLKKVPYLAFKTGLFVSILVLICLLILALFHKISLFESFFTFLFVFGLVSLVSLYSLAKKMDIMSYRRLKKIRKKCEVYEYKAPIQAIYEAVGVSPSTNVDNKKDNTRINSFLLIVDNQKIYLDKKSYQTIKNTKKVSIFIAKLGNVMVLYDYKKIEN